MSEEPKPEEIKEEEKTESPPEEPEEAKPEEAPQKTTEEKPELAEAPAPPEPEPTPDAPSPEPTPIPLATAPPVETEVVDEEREQSTTPQIIEDPRREKLRQLCERVIEDGDVRQKCMVTIDKELEKGSSVESIIDSIAGKYREHIDFQDEEDEGEEGEEEPITPSEFVAVKVPDLLPPPPVPDLMSRKPPKKGESEAKPTP